MHDDPKDSADEPDGHPAAEDGTPDDDPFAFPDDGEDVTGPRADEAPFAFPDDDGDGAPGEGDRPGSAVAGDRTPEGGPTRDAADDGPAPVGTPEDPTPAGHGAAASPPGPRRRRRGARGRAAERTEDEALRIRAAAEAASARAQAVGVRWLAVAGIVLVVLVGATTLIGGRRGGPTGGDVAAGEQLPDFAAPLATRPKLDHDDVNVAQEDGQGEAGKHAACSISDPSVVTSCALLKQGPLVLVLFSRGVQECVEAVDEVDHLRARFPALRTLAVATLGQHDATAETAAARRWTLPVAYDRDRGFSALLGAPACPLVLFVRQDGAVEKRIIGHLTTNALTAAMAELARSATPSTGTRDTSPAGR